MATKLFYQTTRDRFGKAVRTGLLTPVAVGSIAEGNRHTGKPHKHEREIARHSRQNNREFYADLAYYAEG